jgi:hypothetical protein
MQIVPQLEGLVPHHHRPWHYCAESALASLSFATCAGIHPITTLCYKWLEISLATHDVEARGFLQLSWWGIILSIKVIQIPSSPHQRRTNFYVDIPPARLKSAKFRKTVLSFHTDCRR